MSRIRSVHPGLWTDDNFVSLSLAARLFLIGIWNEADDFGLFEWKPLRLKMRLAPADNIDAAAILSELERLAFVVRLSRGGKDIGAVKNFRKFQRPQKPGSPLVAVDDEIKAIIALRDEGSVSDTSDSATEPVRDHSGSATVNPPQMERCKGIGKDKDSPPLVATDPAPEKKGGEGNLIDCLEKVLAAYPKSKLHSQPRVLAAIQALPPDDWPAIIAGCAAYAADLPSKKTTNPVALDRFIRERIFENFAPQSTGPPLVFVAVDTPEWRARVAAGHRSTLRQTASIDGKRVEGWRFPAPSPQTGIPQGP